MANLASAAEVRILVKTSLNDEALDAVIARVEAEITHRIGVPQDDEGTVTKTVTKPGEGDLLFMPTEIVSVESIVEDGVTLTVDEYRTWSGGVIERQPEGGRWGDLCVVIYKPVDDRERRKQAIIDLVRLVLERTAMKTENVAGEYSFTAPDNWEAELRKVIKRLTFITV